MPDLVTDVITTSDNLPIIVDDIREKAWAYQQTEGVYKALATEVGQGEKGSSVSEPFWDPSGATAQVLTEGVPIEGAVEYVNDYNTFTAVESGHYTVLTKNDMEDATDNVKDRHAAQHGITLANKVELQGHTAAQLFTAEEDISSREITDLDLAKMKARIMAQKVQAAGNYNCVGSSGLWLSLAASLAGNPSFGLKGSMGEMVMDKYFVGTIFGDIELFQTDIPYDPTDEVHVGAFFKSDALGMFVPRAFELDYETDARLRGTRLVSTQRYGFGVRADKLGIKFSALNGLLVDNVDRMISKVNITNIADFPGAEPLVS